MLLLHVMIVMLVINITAAIPDLKRYWGNTHEHAADCRLQHDCSIYMHTWVNNHYN